MQDRKMERNEFRLPLGWKVAFFLAFVLAIFILDPGIAATVSHYVLELLHRAIECKNGCPGN